MVSLEVCPIFGYTFFVMKKNHFYIYTPEYQNSTLAAHILEHTLLNVKQDFSHYLHYFYDCEGNVGAIKTHFTFSQNHSIATIINLLQKPISKESYLSQKIILKNELEPDHI